MPSVPEVLNRAQPIAPATWYTATITAKGSGRQVTITLDPGGSVTTAINVDPAAVVGNRVIVAVTPIGNFALGIIG